MKPIRTQVALLLFSCLSCVALPIIHAQEIAIQRPPYYVGEPVVLQISIDGVEGGTEPTCRYVGSSGAQLSVAGPQISTQSMSRMQIINGRMTRSESRSYTYTFQVTASEAGEFEIGPFEVQVDGETKNVESFTKEFAELENDPDVQIEVKIEEDSIYVGQEVPVSISWAFSGENQAINHAFNALQIRSPLFEQFEFADTEPTTRTPLTISTAQGDVLVDAEVTQKTIDGRQFIVVSGQRIMRPQSTGVYTDIPVTCRTEKVTGWKRSFFGDLSPARVTPAVAAGAPISFTVKAPPADNRPTSYSGAVGSGFSIDVSANRSVVRVGDPISLEVKLKGNGNLENLALPDLASSGMDASIFQLPSEPPSGTFTGSEKQFKLSVRAKQEGTDQIPAIQFSWFDPKTEQYQTTMSKPIALQVMEAQVVSAAGVFSGAKPENQSGSGKTSPLPQSLSLVGANLAIQRDPSVLMGSGNAVTSQSWLLTTLYVAGLAAIAGAILLQRNSAKDPEIARKKAQKRELLQKVSHAMSMPHQEATDSIASALRAILPDCTPGSRSEVESIIAQCEGVSYSRGKDNSAPDIQSLANRAVSILEKVL